MREVRVRGLRSLNEAALSDLGDFSVMAGLNNSGKSNFLRALELFFNNTVDGSPLDMRRDFTRSKAKKKQLVRVDVHFHLPSSFGFRKDLDSVERLVGRDVEVSKEWVRDRALPIVFLNGEKTNEDDTNRVNQFLNLISFRYIPNRVVPTEVIRGEHEALRQVLTRRMSRSRELQEEFIDDIRSVATALTSDLSSALSLAAPGVDRVRLATPEQIADLVFSLGYWVEEDGIEVGDEYQGSGFQSLLMLETLRLIDLDRYQQFGWKQASVWAVEEPESSLHTALEVQVARFLRDAATKKDGRLQVVATSHSDLMVQYADRGYLVEKRRPSTARVSASTAAEAMSPTDLLDATARCGISRWINPILLFPLDPLILVEGKTDRHLVERGLSLLGVQGEFRVACLADLTGREDRGGDRALKAFLKENLQPLSARSAEAPVLVVLDWDAAREIDGLNDVLSETSSRAVAWDATQANPRLGESFKGVERFLSDRIIEQADRAIGGVVGHRRDCLVVVPRDYDRLKGEVQKVVADGLALQDIAFAAPFLKNIAEMAGLTVDPDCYAASQQQALPGMPETAGATTEPVSRRAEVTDELAD